MVNENVVRDTVEKRTEWCVGPVARLALDDAKPDILEEIVHCASRNLPHKITIERPAVVRIQRLESRGIAVPETAHQRTIGSRIHGFSLGHPRVAEKTERRPTLYITFPSRERG